MVHRIQHLDPKPQRRPNLWLVDPIPNNTGVYKPLVVNHRPTPAYERYGIYTSPRNRTPHRTETTSAQKRFTTAAELSGKMVFKRTRDSIFTLPILGHRPAESTQSNQHRKGTGCLQQRGCDASHNRDCWGLPGRLGRSQKEHYSKIMTVGGALHEIIRHNRIPHLQSTQVDLYVTDSP